MGRQIPVMNPAASLFSRNSTAPTKSFSLSPKRPMGVLSRMRRVRAVGVPSSLYSSLAFCSEEKKPGAMALTRMPTLEK